MSMRFDGGGTVRRTPTARTGRQVAPSIVNLANQGAIRNMQPPAGIADTPRTPRTEMQRYQGLAGSTQQVAPRLAQAPAPMLGGGGMGGGGGGGGGAAPEPPAQRFKTLPLEDWIKDNFLIQQSENEGERMLEDYDAESMLLQGETEGEQALRSADLESMMADRGRENAGSFAARGLDRSGLVFQEQDRINEEGVRRQRGIDEMLTELLSNRGRGRQDVSRNAQRLVNDRIAQETKRFNDENLGQVAI